MRGDADMPPLPAPAHPPSETLGLHDVVDVLSVVLSHEIW